MPLTVTQIERVFYWDGRRLADPDPSLPIEEVRAYYATTYPALNNASYTEENTETGVKIVFTTAIGTKG